MFAAYNLYIPVLTGSQHIVYAISSVRVIIVTANMQRAERKNLQDLRLKRP